MTMIGPGVRTDLPHDAWSDRTAGIPDGPLTYRAEFGRKVGTFTKRRADLDPGAWRKVKPLMFHVPHELRGQYRPERLANYDPEREYLIDSAGFRMCEGKRGNGSECRQKAVNRQPYCARHGARLHPLDKTVQSPADPATMSRYELLVNGYIDVEDLTDDEIKNGLTTAGGPRNRVAIPRDIYNKILQRHWTRAEELLKEGLIPAVECLTAIASNEDEIYEAADRIKAAQFIITRVMGNNPQVVQLGVAQEPWQRLVQGVATTTRAKSREQRGMAELMVGSEGAQRIADRYWDADGNEIIEAEVEDVDSDDVPGMDVGSESSEGVPAEAITGDDLGKGRGSEASRPNLRVPRKSAKTLVTEEGQAVVPKKAVRRPRKITPDIKGGDNAFVIQPRPAVRMRRPGR